MTSFQVPLSCKALTQACFQWFACAGFMAVLYSRGTLKSNLISSGACLRSGVVVDCAVVDPTNAA